MTLSDMRNNNFDISFIKKNYKLFISKMFSCFQNQIKTTKPETH